MFLGKTSTMLSDIIPNDFGILFDMLTALTWRNHAQISTNVSSMSNLRPFIVNFEITEKTL